MDDKVTTWVELQRKVWNCDDELRAQIICLENSNGDAVVQWPVELENLGAVIGANLEMQSSELPKGNHRFRLVAYADKARKVQLNELPQTLRGRSTDATAAYSDAIALQRATAMAVTNLESTLAVAQRYGEKLEERLSEMTENFRLAFDKLTESNAENFDQKLRFAEFEAKQRRADQMMESILTCVTPVLTIALEKFGPKLLNMDPATVEKLIQTAAPAKPEPPAQPPALQGASANVEPIEPDSASVVRVSQPEQRPSPRNVETRHSGNRKRDTAKRSGTPKRTNTATKGRKRT